MDKPKVLVVGINPWIDNSGINTLITFFEDWGAESLAHIYTRAGLPNTRICSRFFRISEQKVIQSIFRRGVKTGECVANAGNAENEQSGEKRLYARKHSPLMSFCRELVWFLGRWKTEELNGFLDDYAPDVLFFPVYSTVYMNRLQNYIRRYTGKPVVLYSSDDNYSYRSVPKTPLALLQRCWLRHNEKKLLTNADRIMVISPKQKEEYDRQFKTDCVVLTKGVDFSQTPFCPKLVRAPIKMVYTGKLIIGRWKTLARIAQAMENINRDQCKITLDIYTTDPLTPQQSQELNRGGCTVRGALPLDQVQQVQKEADVLVFVESLEKKHKHTARLSFSTKITDYLKNGKCIFAVGDREIAPIDYFVRYDSAVTATSYDEIEEKLNELVADPSMIETYGQKAYQCGKENHSKTDMQTRLEQTIAQVAAEGGK